MILDNLSMLTETLSLVQDYNFSILVFLTAVFWGYMYSKDKWYKIQNICLHFGYSSK